MDPHRTGTIWVYYIVGHSQQCSNTDVVVVVLVCVVLVRVAPLKNVKIVILGQDPYHGMGQAHGMSFSVKKDIDIPPSLVNIYKELYSDIGCRISEHGNLTSWAEQGVLLLNTVLTVRSGHPHSHRNIGWEKFTDAAIRGLNEQDRPIVYFLWGNAAKQKKTMLTNPKHLVIESAHPSPLSAYKGFFGSKPFSQANDFFETLLFLF